MQDADDVVDVTLVDRHPRVLTGADMAEDDVEIIVQVDAEDLLTRHHDVIDGDVLEIENRQQHALVATRDHAAGFVDHGAQLVTGQAVGAAADIAHAEQAQQAIGDAIDQPDQRVEQLEQRFQHQRGRIGDALRIHGGHGLGRHFGKDQHHDGQHGGRDGRTRDITEVMDRDDGRQRGGQVVDEVVADQDDADQAVRTGKQAGNTLGAALTALGAVTETVAVDRHHAGLGTREEGRQDDQDDQ